MDGWTDRLFVSQSAMYAPVDVVECIGVLRAVDTELGENTHWGATSQYPTVAQSSAQISIRKNINLLNTCAEHSGWKKRCICYLGTNISCTKQTRICVNVRLELLRKNSGQVKSVRYHQ